MLNSNFIKMTESNHLKIKLIAKIIAAGCFLSMILCYKLWINHNSFPMVPVFSFLPALKHPLDHILFLLLLVNLLSIFISNSQKLIISAVLLSFIISLFDINRWQPWFYQYSFMLFMLIIFNNKADTIKQQQAILTTFKLMIAAIYVWSGLQKLNPLFFSEIYPWLMEPITNHLQENSIEHLKFIGYLFPVFEIATGVCLLIASLQRFAVIAVIAMHLFILFSVGPLGHNFNPVIWPWNIVMILFTLILFKTPESVGFTGLKSALTFHTSKITILIFVIFPFLNFFNCWDSYLSHNLYSGNTANGIIHVTDSVAEKLPVNLQPYIVPEDKTNAIAIKYWCISELGVPPYPELRNYEAIKNSLKRYSSDETQLYLEYVPKLKFAGF
jgi:uncharacterized membrane protein YphA (DoxX/SURF4 family)